MQCRLGRDREVAQRPAAKALTTDRDTVLGTRRRAICRRRSVRMIGLAIGPGVIAVLASAIARNAIITFAALALVVFTPSVSGHASQHPSGPVALGLRN